MRTQQIVNRQGEEIQSTAIRQMVSYLTTQNIKRELGERVAQKYSVDVHRPIMPHSLASNEQMPFSGAKCLAKAYLNDSRNVFELPKSSISVSGYFEDRDSAAERVKQNLHLPTVCPSKLPPVNLSSSEFHADQLHAAEIVRHKYKFEADVAAVLDYGVPKGLEGKLPRVVHEGNDHEDAMKAAQRRREEMLDFERQELLKRPKWKAHQKELNADVHQTAKQADFHLDLPKVYMPPQNLDGTRVPAPPTAPKPADDAGSRDFRARKVKEAFEAAKNELEDKNSRKVRKGCDGLSYNIDVSSFKPATSSKRLDRAHEKVLAWNANTAKRGVGFKSKKRKMEEAKKIG